MLELIYLVLRAFGFMNHLPAGIPMVLDILPSKVTIREWDEVMGNVFGWNIMICLLIFTFVTVYYFKFFKIAGPSSIHGAWVFGLVVVFLCVYIVSVLLAINDLSTRDNLPANVGEIIFPVGFFMATDAVLLYLFLSSLYTWWPVIIKGALPPAAWLKR